MNLSVYQLPDCRYLLMPDCTLPSIACRRAHGQMTHRGQIEVDETRRDAAWLDVHAQIGRQTYALVDARTAQLLLGADIETRLPSIGEAALTMLGVSEPLERRRA